MKTIVVIGAGFCGAVAAARLLRAPSATPLQVVLINRSGPMARGVAYGTRTEQHVLNVPAGRMGAFPEDEAGFLRYAQQQDPQITGSSFVPRRLFGDYLEWLLDEAVRQAPSTHRFRAVAGDVSRIDAASPSSLRVEFLDATQPPIEADRVVLALGNFAPAHPTLPMSDQAFQCSPRYLRDPWRPGALQSVDPAQPVLLLGTGLTMLDIVLNLREAGHRAPIHALSRRGLMPQQHRKMETPPAYQTDLPQRLPQTPTARAYVRAVRDEVREMVVRGIDWRDVIGGLRASTPALWRHLPVREQQRFLRHLRPYWDVHRHRCAPELGARLQAEQDAGTLRPIAGRLLKLQERDGAVEVTLRRRRGEIETLAVGHVINCTGPEADTRSVAEPLIASLRDAGLVQPDALGLGLQVADDYSLIGSDARAAGKLYYVGPFLRAQHWEATAVPELRQHVARLIDHLAISLSMK